MAMRIQPDESYADWLERARTYECNRALQDMKNGVPVPEALEELSKRLVQKGLHPILKAIRDTPTNYDAEASRKRYFEELKGKTPSSDHIIEDKNV